MNSAISRSAARFFCLSFLIVAAVPSLHALGAHETSEPSAPGSRDSYIVNEAEKPVNETFLRNVYVNTAISAFAWNGFITENGKIELKSDSEFTGTGYRIEEAVRIGRYEVRRLRLTFRSAGEPGAGKKLAPIRFTVADLANDKGAITVQPFQYALRRAAAASGTDRGYVRLVRMDLDGETFTADVEIKP